MAKKITLALLIIAVLVFGFIEFKGSVNKEERAITEREDVYETPAYETYSNADLGFSFRYPSGPDGYTLRNPAVQDPEAGLMESLMLVHAEDLSAIENPPQGGEGPAAINILVFTNEEKQQARAWAEDHNQYSSIQLALGDVQESVIGGANAVRYRADGLYATEMAVVAHGSRIYVISAGFLDESSPTLRDYEPLLQSVTFIPEPGQL